MSFVANLRNSSATAHYTRLLLAGDRQGARGWITQLLTRGLSAYSVLTELIWPAMEQIQVEYKDNNISLSALNLATRLNRSIADQLGEKLERQPEIGRTCLIFCGDDEPEELGAQIAADLFEAEGWRVLFAGGGVPNDEILRLIGHAKPDLLLLFATRPRGMPAVRQLIDYLRQVNACPAMQVMCCGGIYKRAEGLAEEIGADLYAADAHVALEVVRRHPNKKASLDQQTVGRMRRLRRAEARRTTREAA
ncbi:MAG: B12-binding domain-containing protein [Phycisphaerae bacterium]